MSSKREKLEKVLDTRTVYHCFYVALENKDGSNEEMAFLSDKIKPVEKNCNGIQMKNTFLLLIYSLNAFRTFFSKAENSFIFFAHSIFYVCVCMCVYVPF